MACRETATLAALARGDINPVNVIPSEATLAPHCVWCSAGGNLPHCLRNGPAGDRHARCARSRWRKPA